MGIGMPQTFPTGIQINKAPRPEDSTEAFAQFLLDMREQMTRMAQRTWDTSHPVDEYVSGPGTFISPQEIQPTYDMISERIEQIVIAGFPGNATGVVLQLGDRYIPIDTTRGTANGGVIAFDCGIVLKPHERRLISFATNGPTTGYFVGLSGYASDVFETV
jgi:hypothetical protein